MIFTRTNAPNKCAPANRNSRLPVSLCVGAVEKDPKEILGRDVEKDDLTEFATINDLILGRGQVTPKTSLSLVKRTFPTGSLGLWS